MTTDVAVEAGITRPLRADARRNYDALVAAAREVFSEQGTSASLEEIARRAGVGIGTLYRHFPRRDALVEAVYVEEVERMVRDAERIAAGNDAWLALELWMRRLVEYVSAKRVLIDGLNRESAVLSACRSILHESGAPILARAQAAGAARGDVQTDDAMRLVQGLAAVTFPTAEDRDRVVGLAIDGLRAPRSS
ncbi:MAG TPA: helix-turn-helix domain-containing protein [Pseudolysinimonas sp.]|jgi:AcrR family transcriptional regulator|nr:helix-turn-helix domain-containing protein [Pseudolysinimonas sp.]